MFRGGKSISGGTFIQADDIQVDGDLRVTHHIRRPGLVTRQLTTSERDSVPVDTSGDQGAIIYNTDTDRIEVYTNGTGWTTYARLSDAGAGGGGVQTVVGVDPINDTRVGDDVTLNLQIAAPLEVVAGNLTVGVDNTTIGVVGGDVTGLYTGGNGVNITGASIDADLNLGLEFNPPGRISAKVNNTTIGIDGGGAIQGLYSAGNGVSLTGAVIAARTNNVTVGISGGGEIQGLYTGGDAITITGADIDVDFDNTTIGLTGGGALQGLYTAGNGITFTGATVSARTDNVTIATPGGVLTGQYVGSGGISVVGNTISGSGLQASHQNLVNLSSSTPFIDNSINTAPLTANTTATNTHGFNAAGTHNGSVIIRSTNTGSGTAARGMFIAGNDLGDEFIMSMNGGSATGALGGARNAVIRTSAPNELLLWGSGNKGLRVQSGGVTHVEERLTFTNNGAALPTAFPTISGGLKMNLIPGTDYNIGIAGGEFWHQVNSAADQHRWYGGTTRFMTMKQRELAFDNSNSSDIFGHIQATPDQAIYLTSNRSTPNILENNYYANVAHRFWTGGSLGVQTEKLTIDGNGVAFTTTNNISAGVITGTTVNATSTAGLQYKGVDVTSSPRYVSLNDNTVIPLIVLSGFDIVNHSINVFANNSTIQFFVHLGGFGVGTNPSQRTITAHLDATTVTQTQAMHDDANNVSFQPTFFAVSSGSHTFRLTADVIVQPTYFITVKYLEFLQTF